MERAENWYSVIRYCPDKLKGETINVGVILNNFDKQEVYYRLLSVSNIKLKALLQDSNSLELYKVYTDYLNYYFEESIQNQDIFFSSSIDAFYTNLKDIFPKGMTLTEPTFALTEDSEKLFNQLMDIYIGKVFLKENEKSKTNVKQYVRNAFSERSLINHKIKTNARINPIKNKELISFQVDFVYKNGVVNLMQVAPSKDNLHNWFNKLNTLVENYNSDSVYHVLMDDNIEEYPDKTFIEMIEYLRERTSTEQFRIVNIRSQNFIDLCEKIEQTGKYVSDFESELNVS
ncbi:DUF3037 domain-containing protein [Psychrobacillus sp. FSL K6-2365]|uniref:DUF3037 domain-containing protein n=1 Tax=Psychrobacillus sp. FSL K6-2365 TaxID=2921546 RepID=UPI0030F600C9